MEKINYPRENLILSADDFGISPLANRNILALVENKKVNRVAVMTNGVFSAAEIERLKNSSVMLDIHLDPHDEIHHQPGKKEGVLKRTAIFLLKYFSDRLNAPSMELRWEKQLEKFREIFGKNPDGLNSHEYVHFFPAYFKISLKLAQKNNIPFIRFGKESILKNNHNVGRILRWLQKKDMVAFTTSSLDSSDHLVSLNWPKDIRKFLSHLPAGTTEIVCHPERPNEFELIQKYF